MAQTRRIDMEPAIPPFTKPPLAASSKSPSCFSTTAPILPRSPTMARRRFRRPTQRAKLKPPLFCGNTAQTPDHARRPLNSAIEQIRIHIRTGANLLPHVQSRTLHDSHSVRGDAVSCPICEKRKPKRFCPAKGEKICAICCGTYREVTIDCPVDCPHLIAARRYEI